MQMPWYWVVGPAALGIGLVLAGFRRKDKEPRGKVGVVAALLLLVFGICLIMTTIGRWFAGMGAWLGNSVLIAAAVLITSAAFIGTGVFKDIVKDGIPDRPTFLACMFGPLLVATAAGAIWGADVHDQMTHKIEQAKVSVETGSQAGADR